jgi:tetratricopeptide (TPR) repeat protein
MYETTDAERAVLPIYCKDTQGFAGYGDKWGSNASPLAKKWVAQMGETFWAMHHYCRGLVNRNRALRPGVPPRERKVLLEGAAGEYTYVLNNLKDPNFILLPEIYTRIGEARLLASDLGAAEKAFSRARAIKPDYWPAYSHWAEHLMQTGRQAEAKQLVKTGLEHAPHAKMLVELYRLLGGRHSEIVPVVKNLVPGKAADQQRATNRPERRDRRSADRQRFSGRVTAAGHEHVVRQAPALSASVLLLLLGSPLDKKTGDPDAWSVNRRSRRYGPLLTSGPAQSGRAL